MQTLSKKEKLLPIFSNKKVDMKKEMLAGLTTFLTMAPPSVIKMTVIFMIYRNRRILIQGTTIAVITGVPI